MGLFRGMPPVVAPKGDLVFEVKAKSPLTIYTTDWGVGYAQIGLELFSRGKINIAIGCSKCW
jgi:hypothetical protein